jgi:hypothetical protein
VFVQQDNHSPIAFCENCAFHKTMWKRMVGPNRRPDNVIQPMHFACMGMLHAQSMWHLIAFLLQQWFHKHISVFHLYTHCLSCLFFGSDNSSAAESPP